MLGRQKKKTIFYWKYIPKSVLSVTTLAYSNIFSKFYLLLIQFIDEFLCPPPGTFRLHQIFSANIVKINSPGGATVPYAAYSVHGLLCILSRYFCG